MNFCPNCGARIPSPDDLFCMNCGYKLPHADAEPAAPEAAPQPADPQPPAAPAEAPPQPTPTGQPATLFGTPPAAPAVGGDTAEFIAPQAFQPVTQEVGDELLPLFTPPPAQAAPAQQPDDLLQLIDTVNSPPAQAAQQAQPGPAGQPLFAREPQQSAPAAQRPASPAPQEAPRQQPKPAAPQRPAAQAAATPPAGAPPAQAQPTAAVPAAPVAPQPVQAQPAAQAVAQPATQAAVVQPVVAPPPAPQPEPEPPKPQLPPQPAAPAMESTRQNIFGEQPRQRYTPPSATRATNLFDQEPAQPRRRVPTPPPVELPDDDRPRRSPGRIVATVVIVVLIFVVAVSATTLVMLYFSNRPAKTIDKFAAAIDTLDYDTLNEITALRGVAPTQDGWNAFCDAFSQTAGVNRLRSQLLKQAGDPGATDLSYPAVGIEGEAFFLFIKRYYITIDGVELLAPGAAAGTVAVLNDVSYNGVATGEGVLYSGLMPGLYTCALGSPEGASAGAEPVEIEIFQVDGPNRLEGAPTGGGTAETADITIENCRSDDAEIYVNNMLVGAQPKDGVVQLPGVAVGSTILIIATDEDGDTWQASVVFGDSATTSLRFGDYQKQGGGDSSDSSDSGADDEALATAKEMGKAGIDPILATFYTSYLDCINAQSMDKIKNSTASNNTFLAERIKYTGNASNLFEFSSATCDANSWKASVLEGLPCVEFNATFGYKYKPREGDEGFQADTNNQSVQMVYQDGEWRVNRIIFVTDADFTAHKTADFAAATT